MQFDSISAFFDMGGYAFYVWLSYGVSLGVLLILFLSSMADHNKIKQQIAQRQQRENKLREAAKQQQAQANEHHTLNNPQHTSDETNEALS